MPSPLLLAALGSSFAAGPGLPPYDDVAALRSRRNYPHLLALQLGAALVDLTVSGATTASILHTPQVTMDGTTFAPQLAGLPAGTDVVTVTAGGNDLQFLGSMLSASWRRHDPGHPMVAVLEQQLGAGVAEPTPSSLAAAAEGLVQVVEAARRAAPAARVVLVDYLTVVDEASADAAPFDLDDLATFLRIQSALETAFDQAASRTGAELVRASTLSRGHALGSAEPFVFGFETAPARIPASFHPNARGMEAVARRVATLLS
ncbi:MAG: GDSL-type esterase/lipase family protein [Actinomycetota bacterium]|nr:GDSL-type esterase/lipase family protein [Actinomycetota bacterium]